MNYITEPEKRIPVNAAYDTVVVGGGIAGIAAAAAVTDNFDCININELQSNLRQNGVVLHESELLK